MAGELETRSPAEFFAENRTIAGFDNPGKSLYTTVRELVENGLDAAEAIGVLPDISVTIAEVPRAQLDALRGLEAAAPRGDVELYAAGAAAKKKGKQKRKRDEDVAAAAPDTQQPASRGGLFYRVTVKDNGCGMPHAAVPDMLGRVLSGTKYGVRQTRGKFGLGAKMALIWSKLTTGLPFSIVTATPGADHRSRFELDIDIARNAPNVHDEERMPNPDNWHGSELSVTIEGNWPSHRSKLLSYLRQLAIVTPYAALSFEFVAADGDARPPHSIKLAFRRRTNVVPPLPRTARHHPASANLELIKRLLASSSAPTLAMFLAREFDGVGAALSARLAAELQRRSGVPASSSPRTLTAQDAMRLHQLLREVHFADPSALHLSPAGEYNLRLGIMKELRPELVATHAGEPRALDGHAFIVEAAVALGGRELRPGISVFRFANRIPLLFEAGADVATRTALRRINWAAYRINASTDRIGVLVSLVSTRVPFKGAGKEYVGDDVPAIASAVRGAIQACAAQLRVKIARAATQREHAQRKRELARYVPNAAAAVAAVLQRMASTTGGGPKRRRLEEEGACRDVVVRGDEPQLAARLADHVARVDADMALEYQVSQGLAASRGGANDAVWLVGGAAGQWQMVESAAGLVHL